MVAVNEYHFCKSILSQNGFGLPKALSFFAMLFHSFQEADSSKPFNFAGVSQVPLSELSVIEPFVINTKSFLPSTISVLSLKWSTVALFLSADRLKSISTTSLFISNLTPFSSRYFFIGRTTESY